jgi:hypothetical protein
MKKITTIAIVAGFILAGTPLLACTAFMASRGDTVYVGNNEDYINPLTKVWFEPRSQGKNGKVYYGRVYFGFDNFWPQGGMNDQGLFFDGFATKTKKIKESLHKPKYIANLIDKAMAECATVKEVLEVFGRYNLNFMERSMFMFADVTGDSVIIEGDAVVRKRGRYQIATNFYQSEIKDDSYPCERYKLAAKMLENGGDITVDSFRRILAAVHNEGDFVNTLYSNIYDLKRKRVYLYYFHNFENKVVIELEDELKKGKHSYDLPSLFPKSFAAETYLNTYKRRKAIARVNVNPKIYDDYIGLYEMPSDMVSNTAIAITKHGNKLYGFYPEFPSNELLPTSNNQFLNVSKSGVVKVTFEKGKAGVVPEMKVELKGQTFTAKKIR